jgi:DNA-directed RNA polymerase specialized sigma subunit
MKVLIDRFYAENYDLLVGAAKKRIQMSKSVVEPQSVVSSSYMYLISKSNNITEEEIPKMAMGFICMELSWYSSKTNREENVKYEEFDPLMIGDYNHIDNEILKMDIEDFRSSLDRLEKIVFDCYYYKGLTKKKELAEHFNIDVTSAWFLIRDLKDKFKKYAKTEERL